MKLYLYQKCKYFLITLFFLFSVNLHALEKEAVSVQLKWKHSFQFAGYYAAIEKGFYADEGLNVTLKEIGLKRDFVQSVLDGESEYGVGDSSLVLYYLQKKPVVLVSQIFQYSPLVFISHRDSGITTSNDLMGKKIMYSLNSSGDAPLKTLIIKTLGGFDGIDIQNFTSYKDFIDKKVDVTSAYSTSQPFWLKKQGIDVNIIDPKSYGINFYGDNLFTTQKELKEHPLRVKKMKRATIKGWEYALKHQDEIIDLIIKKYAPAKHKDVLSFEARGIYQMIMPDLSGIGTLSKEKYKQVVKIYNQLGVINNKTLNDNFFYVADKKGILLTDSERVWLKNNPTIKVGGGPDWAPFDFVDEDGKYSGIANDYFNLISKITGLKFEIVIDIWSNNLQKMKDKKIDLLGAVYYTKERKTFMNYTKPYFEMLDYFFIRDDLDVKTLKDLDGKIVAVPRGYAHGETIKKEFPNIKILTVETFSQSIDAVLEKKADILFDTYASLSYVIKKESINTIIPFKSYRGDNVMKLHMTTSKDKVLLSSIIDKAIDAITDEEKKEIHSKWLRKNIQTPTDTIFLTDEEKKWLLKNPKVTFAGDPNWLPFEAFDKNGKYIGIVAEYLAEIEKQFSIKFKPILVSNWMQTVALAEKGDVDIISDDVDAETPSKHYRAITPYIKSPIVIVMRDSQNFVNDIRDISEKKIAIIEGYGYNNKIKQAYPNQKFTSVKDADVALSLLSRGEIDAVLLSMPKAAYLIRLEGYSSLKIVGKTDITMNLTLFVKNTKPELYEMIKRAMKKITTNKELDILSKWQKIEFAKKTDYTLLYQLAIFFTILILGTLYWNRKLSNEIDERKRIENDLHIEKENFKALFEKVSDGNLIIKNGKFTTSNSAALKMLGLKNVKELLESTPDKWSPEFQYDGIRSDEKAKQMINICFKQGNHRFEWIHKDINENEFWVDVGLTKILYEGSIAIYVVWRDISQQKLLEASLKNSESQMRTLIDNIPLYVIVSSFEGDILLANPKTLKDYGFIGKDISKVNILQFYADPTVRDEVISEIQTKGKIEKKIVKFKLLNGTHSILMSVLPIKYSGQDVLLSIGVDLTERLAIEEELISAKKRADAANKSKSEFLANMSHEIRTPMNAIIGFTELLSEQIAEPRLKSYVGTIQSASHTLLTLINDILDLSKIEAGKLEINKTPTNLYALSDEVSSIFMMSMRNKGLDFIVEVDNNIPKSLLIDEVRLRQVLLNIIGNAVKFTEKGFVKLSIKAFNVDNHNSKLDLEISVQDTGIGIQKNQLEYIFKEFEQTQGQDNRKYGGTGLGLCISQRLCRMMDGKISVKSTKDEGTTFCIYLYSIDISSVVDENRLENELNLDVKSFVFEHAKVLVVDDIEDNRELILKNFENTEIEIVTANDGLEAIEQYKVEKPDLILMDIRMPNMDGYEAASEIKKISNVPIVALTASVMQDDFERLKSKNFDAYLRKPVMRYELFSSLSDFLPYTKVKHSMENKQDSFILSKKTQDNITAIQEKIDDEIKPLLAQALKSNNISDIKTMASKIRDLALKYEIDHFEKYAANLYEAIDSFDILKIQRLLKEFESLEKTLGSHLQ